MRKLILLAALALLVVPARLSATWSIIAIDKATGRVVIASATCAAQGPDELKLVQAVVVPGRGVAAAQAGVDRTHANQKLIYEELQKGTDPAEIIRMLERDPAIESRQFGIIDLQGRRAGRTGSGNRAAALDIQEESADGKILFSVQGNIIASEEALRETARVMRESTADITDRVMLAMEKADSMGGDSRCTCATAPLPGAGCTGKTAHVAYILAADRTDQVGSYATNHPQTVAQLEEGFRCGGDMLVRCTAPWNAGRYFLYLAVYPSNVQATEDANPVRTLRMRYDAWKRARGAG